MFRLLKLSTALLCLALPTSAMAASGTCGSANGVATMLPPTTGFCATGTPSQLTGPITDPYQWTCNGSGRRHSNANCSAPLSEGTIIIGSPQNFSAGDNGNANLLLVQNGNPTQLQTKATLVALAFLVNQPAGTLQLGVYSEPNASTTNPGNLLAQTGVFTARAGWNVVPVNPVSLNPGNYGLAYNPSDNNLSFWKENNTGPCSYKSWNAGDGLQTVYTGSTGNCTPTQWNFYAILSTTVTAPPPPTNGQCGSANGVAVSQAPTSNLCSAGSATSVSGMGPWTWSCTGSNGGSPASCAAPLQQSSGGGGGSGSGGGGTGGGSAAGQDPGPSQSLFNNPYYQCTANYYVASNGSDNNNGSSGAPWATLQHVELDERWCRLLHQCCAWNL